LVVEKVVKCEEAHIKAIFISYLKSDIMIFGNVSGDAAAYALVEEDQ